jgi:hypothetical protein
VVKRTINGQIRRYVERLANRRISTIQDAAFADCHLVYSGAATSTIGGLTHLEGQMVGVLADGNVLDDLLVTSGHITLPRAYSHVVVGLRYDQDSVLETLDIDLGMLAGLGTVQGRRKTVTAVTLRLEQSREFLAGPDADHLVAVKTVSSSFGAAPPLLSEPLRLALPPSWNSRGRVVIKPNGPVPLTILGIAPDIEIGG